MSARRLTEDMIEYMSYMNWRLHEEDRITIAEEAVRNPELKEMIENVGGNVYEKTSSSLILIHSNSTPILVIIRIN